MRGYSEGGVGSGRSYVAGTAELHYPIYGPVEVSAGPPLRHGVACSRAACCGSCTSAGKFSRTLLLMVCGYVMVHSPRQLLLLVRFKAVAFREFLPNLQCLMCRQCKECILQLS